MKNKVVEYLKICFGRRKVRKATSNEIINHLNLKWGGRGCPMCGGREWNITDKFFEIREFNNGDLVIGGPNNAITPVIPVVCKNCGNTIFINPLVVGLLKE